MSVINKYYTRINEIMAEVFDKEADNMEKAAKLLADANEQGRSIFGFGCNHAGLITLELFYRTGGMVTVNPVRSPGMMLELTPITMTSEMERMEGFGDSQGFGGSGQSVAAGTGFLDPAAAAGAPCGVKIVRRRVLDSEYGVPRELTVCAGNTQKVSYPALENCSMVLTGV